MSKPDPLDITVDRYPHEGEGFVARVSVHRPAKLNVLNRDAMITLRKSIENASTHPELRCIILTGGGEKAFIGGADITEMAELTPETAREFITDLHRVCQAIRDCPVPVIARIQGYCLGAGMEIAAACDMRIASTDAQFGMPEVLVGIPSVIEAALLPRLIGWGKTNELLLTGAIISADEAHHIHFVERVRDRDSLDSALREWIVALLNAGPLAIRTQKKLMRQWESSSPDAAIDAGIETFSEAFRMDEPKIYLKRFLKH